LSDSKEVTFADLLAVYGGHDAVAEALEAQMASRRANPAEAWPCRDLKRRILENVDENRSGTHDALATWFKSQACLSGHRFSIGDVPKLVNAGAQHMKLSAQSEDWLLDYGRPAPDWDGSAPPSVAPLRAWQVEALNAWAAHGRHGVIQAVTGTGKSRVGVEAAREALDLDYSVVVCAPSRPLVDQWYRTLIDAGIVSVGRCTGTSKDSFNTHRVIVGTVQTLYRSPPTRADGKVLFIGDECHRYGSDEWKAVLDPSYRSRLGLTATLERNDDGIYDLYHYFGGTPVFEIGFRRAIDDGVVAHYDVKLVGVSLAGDERAEYDEHDEVVKESRQKLLSWGVPAEPFGAFMKTVADMSDDPTHPLNQTSRNYLRAFSKRGEVVANARGKIAGIRRLAPSIEASGGALLFNSRTDTCEHIADVLRDEGIKCEAIHSKLNDAERAKLLRALKAGKVKALVAPNILDEGIDVPDVDLGVVTAGSSSRRQMIQRMGRVLRLKKDGRKATFVVIYARKTTEDLALNGGGSDGFLNLVTESADTVDHLSLSSLQA
jgi:superfamily II DNA or RNA helicase